ncbi:MAG: ferredoxin, partial [Bacteroidaceae bacterium]|nr:ferredoxin [Bacteroidaceae bacterium]
MILHFSGTGNSKHLATLIAEATGERLLDMAALMDKGTTFICLEKDEMLGWVFPVHFWGLPALVRDFIGS